MKKHFEYLEAHLLAQKIPVSAVAARIVQEYQESVYFYESCINRLLKLRSLPGHLLESDFGRQAIEHETKLRDTRKEKVTPEFQESCIIVEKVFGFLESRGFCECGVNDISSLRSVALVALQQRAELSKCGDIISETIGNILHELIWNGFLDSPVLRGETDNFSETQMDLEVRLMESLQEVLGVKVFQ